MAKLRLIKERGENRAFDQDLRGLGENTELENITLSPILTVSGLNSKIDTIKSLAANLKLRLNIQKDTDHTLSIRHTSKDEFFKNHAIEIYSFMLALDQEFSEKVDYIMHFWLENKMLQSMQLEGHKIGNNLLPSGFAWDAYTRIEYPLNMYLHQAGFSISNAKSTVTMSRSDLERERIKLIEDSRAVKREKKAI